MEEEEVRSRVDVRAVQNKAGDQKAGTRVPLQEGPGP